MKNNNVYRTIGIVFMVGGLVAITFRQMGIFAAWLPIGAAFFALGSNDTSNKEASLKSQKKSSKKQTRSNKP